MPHLVGLDELSVVCMYSNVARAQKTFAKYLFPFLTLSSPTLLLVKIPNF